MTTITKDLLLASTGSVITYGPFRPRLEFAALNVLSFFTSTVFHLYNFKLLICHVEVVIAGYIALLYWKMSSQNISRDKNP